MLLSAWLMSNNVLQFADYTSLEMPLYFGEHYITKLSTIIMHFKRYLSYFKINGLLGSSFLSQRGEDS